MKKIIFILICFFICFNNIYALNTDSLYAMDINSGRVFLNQDGDDKRLIASTTKIMTAIVAIENGNLEDVYEVGDEVLTIYGSNIYLEYHEHMMLLDLLYGLMLRSGNDAAVVIANHVTNYNNFIYLMNKKAEDLGMNDTSFSNPTGLDDTEEVNYSSSHDLAILYAYAFKNATFREIVGCKKYIVNGENKTYIWNNRNELLDDYKYTNGGKTGYTPKAGRVLVTSASNNDLNVVIASFNNIYDYKLHKDLYENIFNEYNNTLIIDKDNTGLDSNLYIKESFYYPLTEMEKLKIDKKIEVIEDDDIYGKMYVYLNNNIINTINIYKEKKITFFDKIKRFITNIFN